jgi:hypothetical protein
MKQVSIDIVRHAKGWAIRHNGGILGYAQTRSQAISIARGLVDWLHDQGRPSEFEVGEAEASWDREEAGLVAIKRQSPRLLEAAGDSLH